MKWEMEEMVRAHLEHHDMGVVVDPEILAIRMGLEVLDAPTEGCLIAPHIYVSDLLRAERRAFTIAHELAHELLRRDGYSRWRSESLANYVASALLLPREDFDRDLRRVGWDLIALKARHRHASFEALGRRIVTLRDATMTVWDKPLLGQREPGWYSVPFRHRPSGDERDAAAEAVSYGGPVEIRPGLTAWPVLQHDWHRVITLTAA